MRHHHFGHFIAKSSPEVGFFGIRKPKDNVRNRRLSEAEYRLLGSKRRELEVVGQRATAAQIIRLLALTGCHRIELIKLRWSEVEIEGRCLRLEDSKEGKSVRPVGLPAIKCLQKRKIPEARTDVFPGAGRDNAFGLVGNGTKCPATRFFGQQLSRCA